MTAAAATPVRKRRMAKTGMFGTKAQANVPTEKTARHAGHHPQLADAIAQRTVEQLEQSVGQGVGRDDDRGRRRAWCGSRAR